MSRVGNLKHTATIQYLLLIKANKINDEIIVNIDYLESDNRLQDLAQQLKDTFIKYGFDNIVINNASSFVELKR